MVLVSVRWKVSLSLPKTVIPCEQKLERNWYAEKQNDIQQKQRLKKIAKAKKIFISLFIIHYGVRV